MEQTKAIARKVRVFVEENKHLFKDWCTNDDNLEGMCGISSMILSGQLDQKSIWNKVVWGSFKQEGHEYDYGHAWVRTKEYIIDITATQFGKRNKVYIVKVDNKQYIDECLRDVKHNITHDWGIPKSYIKLMKKFMKKKDL